MLIQELWDCFCRESFGGGSKGLVVPSAIPKQAETPSPSEGQEPSVDAEINSLARHFGGLQAGQRIEMTLQELLTVIPHKRRRADSYAALIKKLRADFDADLTIVASTKKNKNNEQRKD